MEVWWSSISYIHENTELVIVVFQVINVQNRRVRSQNIDNIKTLHYFEKHLTPIIHTSNVTIKSDILAFIPNLSCKNI